MNFQTRNEEGSIKEFNTFSEALREATTDKSVWKISFTLPTNERIRLIRNDENGSFFYEPIEINKPS